MKNRVKDGYADGKERINQLFDINYRFKKILIFFVLQYFFFKLRPPINKISWICLLNLAYWGYCYEKKRLLIISHLQQLQTLTNVRRL